jgi:hypothetical protein
MSSAFARFAVIQRAARKHHPDEEAQVLRNADGDPRLRPFGQQPFMVDENDKETGIVPCYFHSLSEIPYGGEVTTSRSNLAGQQKRRRAVYVCRI